MVVSSEPARPESNKKVAPVTMSKAVFAGTLLFAFFCGVASGSAALSFVGAVAAEERRRRIGAERETNQDVEQRLQSIIQRDIIRNDDITVTFNDIGGLQQVKSDLRQFIINPLQRPGVAVSQGRRHTRGLFSPPKGILLFGRAGTGKTMLAKAIAKECGATFINVSMATLMSETFGETEKRVEALFTEATRRQPCIIFMDEADGIFRARRSTEHETIYTMKTQFMSLWDGFSTNQDARVIVLCATNRKTDLDEAILRRLSHQLEVPLPDRDGRAAILRKILEAEGLGNNVDYTRVADVCDGYSGSDLWVLCQNVALRQMEGPLRTDDFLTMISQRPREDGASSSSNVFRV